MIFRSVTIFLALISTCSSQTGLHLLFPEVHKEYVYVLKTNVSIGTTPSSGNGSFWTLDGKLVVQVYDNFTKARLRLEGLKKTVLDNDGYHNVLDVDDDTYLKEPWEIDYQDNGFIKSIYVTQEPVWSVNLKRALSINFQLTRTTGVAGTYSMNEPCLDEICVMIYTIKGNNIKKYTSFRVPSTRSGYSWSSVPWAADYSGKLVVDSLASSERVYELDDRKGLMNFELNSSYQYKTHDHILSVTADLSLYYFADTPAKGVEKLNLSQTTVQYVATDFGDPSNGVGDSSQNNLRIKTYKLLLKISHKGIDADNIVRNASLIHNMDFIELLNTISQLKYDTLIKLFSDLVLGTSYDMETSKNIFLEVLPHARSDACAKFIKYLVLEEKEKVEDTALLSMIRKIPFNVATLSQKLLEELESLTKLGLDFTQDIRHAGILSFATLAYKTMEVNLVKHDYFDNIVVKYFRMYSDCPQYIDRMVWLQGLCNLGFSADSYTRIITSDAGRDRHERLWAALAGSPKIEEPYNNIVLETAFPVLTNESEHIQLRIMALHSLLSSPTLREPDLYSIHNIVKASQNNHLQRFWSATVNSLEANKEFKEYRVAAYYIPFIAYQVSNPDPLYWATNNYIVSGDEEYGAPSLQILSVGDALGAVPSFLGAKLYTGGRRPYKVALYFIIEGVSTSIHRRVYRFTDANQLNVGELAKILKGMKGWKLKSPEKVHIDVVLKVHDKTVYATHMNQSRFESFNGDEWNYIEDFLRFGSHINQQIVYYPFQTDMHIPSEVGTPIRLQSTIMSFTSIRGNLTTPSTKDLTWRNDLHIRYHGASVTSLATTGPLVRTVHTARVQQSLVAHLPMRFNVSFSSEDRGLELTWPNPSDQQGGVAMHSRAQVSTETLTEDNSTISVETDKAMSDSGRSIFFDCEHPMTWAEVLDKLLITKTGHHNIVSSIQPSFILLNSMLLVGGARSARCGLILQPNRPPSVDVDVLKMKLRLDSLRLDEDSSELQTTFTLRHYNARNPNDTYLDVEVLFKIENSGSNTNFQLTTHGHHLGNKTTHQWTLCLREQDISHTASDQDISIHPASYEGHLTLTFSSNKSECFDSVPSTELTLKYKGIPQNLNGNRERYFEVKIYGRNLKNLGLLDIDLIKQTAWGQLLRSYSQDPLNVTAIIKEKNGLASLSVNRGVEMQLKADNFAWLLDSWTDMQIMKSFGLYRECRLQTSTVKTFSGSLEQIAPNECAQNLILADCSGNRPKFAVIQTMEGLKIHEGGHFVLVKNVGDNNIEIDSTKAGENKFWISNANDTIRIKSIASDIRLYRRGAETALLAPHGYMSDVCGLCAQPDQYVGC